MTRGLRGSDLAAQNLQTREDLAHHLESFHHIPVQRKGETKEECLDRFYKTHPDAKDWRTCRCPECVERRRREGIILFETPMS